MRKNQIFDYKTFVGAFIVALATLILYLPALQNAFVTWDDGAYIYQNRMIASFNMDFVKWSFTTFAASNWHPLTWISHAIDYKLWGLYPMGHHLTSIIFHSINAFLVMLLAIRLFEIVGREDLSKNSLPENSRIAAGIVAGLLFGIHPLHVESAAWVSERKDVLSVFFFLLSILSYIYYARTGQLNEKKNHFWGRFFQKPYLLSFAFFLLGILSKPMVVTLPVILLLLDWYPLKRLQGFRSLIVLLTEKIPFFLLSFASSIVTIVAQRDALATFTGLPLSSRLLSASKSLISYLEKILWPTDLMPFYPYPVNISFFSAEYFVPILFLVGITSAGIYILKTKRQRLWLSVWSYYLITVLPVIGIIQIGSQEFADRYTYLPSIGPFILIGFIAGLFFEAFRKQKMIIRIVSLSVPFVIFLSMSYATVKQIGIWKDGITLWSHEIELLAKKPGKKYLSLYIPFFNRGSSYADRGYLDSAIEDFTEAIYLNPIYYLSYYVRGVLYTKKKDFENALNDYNYAIYLNPNRADIYYSRAFIYTELRRYWEAVGDYTKAINLSADPHPGYYYGRGMVFKKLGYENEAAKDLMQAKNIEMRTSRR